MKKTSKILVIILRIIVVVFLIGSFPVKYYFGQEYCDIMRIIGWGALAIDSIYFWARNKNK